MSKIFKFQIAFVDTDASGIVYHARYIEIAERARMFLFFDLIKNYNFVVRELKIKYIKPLKVGQIVEVSTKLLQYNKISVDLEQKFIINNITYAILKIKYVFVDKDLKLINVPEKIINTLKEE